MEKPKLPSKGAVDALRAAYNTHKAQAAEARLPDIKHDEFKPASKKDLTEAINKLSHPGPGEIYTYVGDAGTPVYITETAVKHDSLKPPMELLPTEALLEIARVLDFGKTKYGRSNWRKGMEWSRLIGAALRHITAFNDGQDKDPETGLSHLAHAGCCIMFLLEYESKGLGMDNRKE